MTVSIGESSRTATHIVFWPQNLTIHSSNAESIPGMTRLHGKVEHREFLGSVVRYSIAVGEHFLLVNEAYQLGEAPIAERTQVTLSLNREKIIAVDR